MNKKKLMKIAIKISDAVLTIIKEELTDEKEKKNESKKRNINKNR